MDFNNTNSLLRLRKIDGKLSENVLSFMVERGFIDEDKREDMLSNYRNCNNAVKNTPFPYEIFALQQGYITEEMLKQIFIFYHSLEIIITTDVIKYQINAAYDDFEKIVCHQNGFLEVRSDIFTHTYRDKKVFLIKLGNSGYKRILCGQARGYIIKFATEEALDLLFKKDGAINV